MAAVSSGELRTSLEHAQDKCDLYEGMKWLSLLPIIGWFFISIVAVYTYFEKKDALNTLAQRVNGQPIDSINKETAKVVGQARKFLVSNGIELHKATLQLHLAKLFVPDLLCFGEIGFSPEFLRKDFFPWLKLKYTDETKGEIRAKLEIFRLCYGLEEGDLMSLIGSAFNPDDGFINLVKTQYIEARVKAELSEIFGELLFNQDFVEGQLPVWLDLACAKLDSEVNIDQATLDMLEPDQVITQTLLDGLDLDKIGLIHQQLKSLLEISGLKTGKFARLVESIFNISEAYLAPRDLNDAQILLKEVFLPYISQHPECELIKKEAFNCARHLFQSREDFEDKFQIVLHYLTEHRDVFMKLYNKWWETCLQENVVGSSEDFLKQCAYAVGLEHKVQQIFGELLDFPEFSTKYLPVLLELGFGRMESPGPDLEFAPDLFDIIPPSSYLSSELLAVVKDYAPAIDLIKEACQSLKDSYGLDNDQLIEIIESMFSFKFGSSFQEPFLIVAMNNAVKNFLNPFLAAHPDLQNQKAALFRNTLAVSTWTELTEDFPVIAALMKDYPEELAIILKDASVGGAGVEKFSAWKKSHRMLLKSIQNAGS
jgi:hypothetical protein